MTGKSRVWLLLTAYQTYAKGAFPKTNPKTPQDVLATLYRHLSVDTAADYLNAAGRPMRVLPNGMHLDELC